MQRLIRGIPFGRWPLLVLLALTLASCGGVPLDPYPNGFANSAGAANPLLNAKGCWSVFNCGR